MAAIKLLICRSTNHLVEVYIHLHPCQLNAYSSRRHAHPAEELSDAERERLFDEMSVLHALLTRRGIADTIDAQTEYQIQQALLELQRGRTTGFVGLC